jgi:hypothetical protein
MEKLERGCDKRGQGVEVGGDVMEKTGGGCDKRGEAGDEFTTDWSGCRHLGGTLQRDINNSLALII